MVRAADFLYRLLYSGVLSRVPESIAVPLGQWGLRLLPLDLLPVFRNEDPRLAITLGGVRLPNPLILSSMYYDTVILRRAMGLGFGAVTAKSITPKPRPGHPQPNLVRIQTSEGPGLVNCNGFHNPGLAAYRLLLSRLPHRVPLIVAAAGESPEDYVAVVEGLAPFGDLVEINISSPNTRLVYGWSERPAELAEMFRAVRKATDKPIIVKVSPDFRRTNEETTIPAALDAGITMSTAGTRDAWTSHVSRRRPVGSRGPRCSRRRSRTCAVCARDSPTASRSSRRAVSTRPTRRSRRSARARRHAPTSPDSSRAAHSWRGESSTPLSRPNSNPQLIHLSTGIHTTKKSTV